MIDFSAFEIIHKYCKDNNYSPIFYKLLYSKYTEEMSSLISSHKEKHRESPNSDVISGFESSCLNEGRLSNYYKLAKEEINEITNDEVKKAVRRQSAIDFWKSVAASVLASFIFVLLVIGFYAVEQDQIKTWIDGNKTEQINSTDNK